ncbi:MAG: hypothetical protein ACR2G4_02630 [Pyrinomonadaceae bacterium]
MTATFFWFVCTGAAWAQRAQTAAADDAEFGPVVRTYLGYLRAEQEVVDDRASRHEVSPVYYRRNSNRIRALRQAALRIARETQNDFLPELYAITRDEFGTLFDPPPLPEIFRPGEVINNTFRYLSTARSGELFYLFERLDVYEQAELLKKIEEKPETEAVEANTPTATNGARGGRMTATRPRRVHIP